MMTTPNDRTQYRLRLLPAPLGQAELLWGAMPCKVARWLFPSNRASSFLPSHPAESLYGPVSRSRRTRLWVVPKKKGVPSFGRSLGYISLHLLWPFVGVDRGRQIATILGSTNLLATINHVNTPIAESSIPQDQKPKGRTSPFPLMPLGVGADKLGMLLKPGAFGKVCPHPFVPLSRTPSHPFPPSARDGRLCLCELAGDSGSLPTAQRHQ
jgi:hypothetical protein